MVPKSTTSTSGTVTVKGEWSDAAVNAAKDLTITQKKRLEAAGIVGIRRPVRIKGETIDSPEQLLKDDKNTKIIHFQRHGQGFHNVICENRRAENNPVDVSSYDPSKNPLLNEELLDSPLTEEGKQQCRNRRPEASMLNPEIIVVSPLMRAIQSAELSWSAHRHRSEVPWVAHEGCREDLGLLVCNRRRNLNEIRQTFPDIDFSLIQNNEDTLFIPQRKETALEQTNRIYNFLLYLRQLEQNEIAVVCHSSWLFTMCNAVMEIEDKSLSSWFLTSEIRSIRVSFVDRDNEKA